MNTLKTSLFKYLAFASILILLFSACIESTQRDSSSIAFNDIQSIIVERSWSDQFARKFDVLDFFISRALAVMSPLETLHQQYRLDFNHQSKTIEVTYKSFIGIDSSQLSVSTGSLDSDTYHYYESLMQSKYICTIQDEKEIPTGGAPAIISFVGSNQTVSKVREYNSDFATKGDKVICSEELSILINSIQNQFQS